MNEPGKDREEYARKQRRNIRIVITPLFSSVLRAGIPRRYSVKLPVSPEPPLHSGLNNVKWTLVTTLRLHQGREFTEEQTVAIKLIARSRSDQPSSPKVNGTSAVTMSVYLNERLNRK